MRKAKPSLCDVMGWLPGFEPIPGIIDITGQERVAVEEPPVERKLDLIEIAVKAALTGDAVPIERRNQRNFRYGEAAFEGLTGVEKKYDANVAAISLLKQINRTEGRTDLTVEDKQTLSRFCGWGAIPQAFMEDSHKDEGWRERSKALLRLLGKETFANARASTPNAHYTSEEVIAAMWATVRRMGFTGGRVLEPACGTGRFFGYMPQDLAGKSRLWGCELEEASAQIAKQLYPDAHIHEGYFEDAKFATAFFDLMIANVPFGSYAPKDAQYRKLNLSIHEYFIVRGLDLLRAGGLMVVVTSRFLMDKVSSSVRELIVSKANLVGAIRLPSTTFKAAANTSVVTDILVLQRFGQNVPKAEAPAFADVEFVEIDGKDQAINGYYEANPAHMLGTRRMARNGMYGRDEFDLTWDGPGDLALAIRQALDALPAPVAEAKSDPVDLTDAESAFAKGSMEEGRYTVSGNGELTVVKVGRVVAAGLDSRSSLRVIGMLNLRSAVHRLLDMQSDAAVSEETIVSARESLNTQYTAFTKAFGCLSARVNRALMRNDPDAPLLWSLESWDEETQTAKKSAIFEKRVIRASVRATSAQSIHEAIALSLDAKGCIDVSYVRDLTGWDHDRIGEALANSGLAFRCPLVEGQWITAADYLSGNVRHKLVLAQSLADTDEKFSKNVEALTAVIPEDIPSDQITVRLGASWVPTEAIEAFAEALMGAQDVATVEHNVQTASWLVKPKNRWDGARYAISQSKIGEWGTKRMTWSAILESALNSQVPTIKDTDLHDKKKLIVNAPETEAVREKLEKMQAAFGQWIWNGDGAEQRRIELGRLYNDRFNTDVEPAYDGSHLTLPGFSGFLALRPEQLNTVWRMISGGNTLLGHAVGAGKTIMAIIAAMEMRRLGIADKPCIVVPNHMLEQFAAEFLRAYPRARILMAGKEDAEKLRRRTMLARIATGSWDCVVITHGAFEKLALGEGELKDYGNRFTEEMDVLRVQAINEGVDSKIIKRLEVAKKNLVARLDALAAKHKKDGFLSLRQLGIDQLFVDEAHLFKNLLYSTKMQRVAGMPQTCSQRAFDMYVKTRMICEVNRNNGKRNGLVFMTATPIANSVVEMYTMQRYVQPEILVERGIDAFDGWAATFGEVVNAVEMKPDCSGFRVNQRFARFVNVPELMGMFRQCADLRTRAELKLPAPTLFGGGHQVITMPKSPWLHAYVQSLAARVDKIKSGHVDPKDDNMLKVTTDGRKAALDRRLVEWVLGEEAESKVGACAAKIVEIWKAYAAQKAAQIVFCDLSTPNGMGWNIYEDLKRKLIDAGVPELEIAFAQHAQTDRAKEELYRKVRAGTVRVLIGSTTSLGVGTNVQERLIAQHDLDPPWRPCDVEQRQGRIQRPGNMFPEVYVFRYVTAGSFDGYMWQTLETKARFVTQVTGGAKALRNVEDIESTVLTYAQVKALASGNPLVMEKAQVEADLGKFCRLEQAFRNGQSSARRQQMWAESMIESASKNLVQAKIDADTAKAAQAQLAQGVALEFGGKKVTSRKDAGEALWQEMLHVMKVARTTLLGNFCGFDVEVRRAVFSDKLPDAYLVGEREYLISTPSTALGAATVLWNALDFPQTEVVRQEDALLRAQQGLESAKVILAQTFEHAERLATLASRLAEIDLALGIGESARTSSIEEETPEKVSDGIESEVEEEVA